MTDFSTRYLNKIKSANPVVNKKGDIIVHQFSFQKGTGDERGVFLFDPDVYEKYKEDTEDYEFILFKFNNLNLCKILAELLMKQDKS